jgi:hypothetical protein
MLLLNYFQSRCYFLRRIIRPAAMVLGSDGQCQAVKLGFHAAYRLVHSPKSPHIGLAAAAAAVELFFCVEERVEATTASATRAAARRQRHARAEDIVDVACAEDAVDVRRACGAPAPAPATTRPSSPLNHGAARRRALRVVSGRACHGQSVDCHDHGKSLINTLAIV